MSRRNSSRMPGLSEEPSRRSRRRSSSAHFSAPGSNLFGPVGTHFIPGLVAGILLKLGWDVLNSSHSNAMGMVPRNRGARGPVGEAGGGTRNATTTSVPDGTEMKMVLVVRADLKMTGGKIAAQCAHAALGAYNELLPRQRVLLKRWEACGQPKIVVTCKNQQEMNELKHIAQRAGLPTFIVSDAGKTQVAAGSKTVLAVGPGPKSTVDSVTRHLRLLR